MFIIKNKRKANGFPLLIERENKMGKLIVKVLDSVENFLTVVEDWLYE